MISGYDPLPFIGACCRRGAKGKVAARVKQGGEIVNWQRCWLRACRRRLDGPANISQNMGYTRHQQAEEALARLVYNPYGLAEDEIGAVESMT